MDIEVRPNEVGQGTPGYDEVGRGRRIYTATDYVIDVVAWALWGVILGYTLRAVGFLVS